MLTAERQTSESATPVTKQVMLADGTWQTLEGLNQEELALLQWEQERKFAQAIRILPKGSEQRAMVTSQAYETVCAVLAAQQNDNEPLLMGLDPRYARLVLELIKQQIREGIGNPHFFEIGYGSGVLLKEVAEHGYHLSGLEVSPTMREQTLELLGERFEDRLLLGDLLGLEVDSLEMRPSLIYWNDVFEHICPDEIGDYLAKIHSLLMPGGKLVTITPNWLLRPSDVTCCFCPPRTTAQGLHLKEYRLGEVVKLLRQAGFCQVSTPLVVSKKRIYRLGSGLRLAKQIVEPLLDRLPVRYARLLCRGMAMSCTIATKRR